MDLNELLKQLVETEDQMARMDIVESNGELIKSFTNAETETPDGENWEEKYNTLKQKYIDTFFNTSPPDEEMKPEEEPEEEEPEKVKSLDDIEKEVMA